MPELPEVELVGRYLRPHLIGRRIRRVSTSDPSYFFLTAPSELKRRLPSETILALNRIGKYLLLDLSSGCQLLLHLGMTGQLILEGAQNPRLVRGERAHPGAAQPTTPFAADAHTHLVLEFHDRGPALFFRDPRKFGKVRWLRRSQSDPRLDKLGPDALEVTAQILFDASRKRRLPIKSLLLDQTVVAGIGNIYADESLFLSRLHPERPALSLTIAECTKLAVNVRRVLRFSIEHGGSSIDDYIHPDGSEGGFQHSFRVYGRDGEPCRKCKTAIERVVIGQRSSHFCPKCQR